MLSDDVAVDPRFRLETERLHALVSHIRLGVLVEDENRHVAMVNDAFCEVFGIPAGDIVGTNCALAAAAVAPLMTDPDRYVSLLTERIEGGVSAVADEVAFRDGRVLERDYVPILVDSTRRGHLWLFRDVTESRRLVELERAAAVRDELRLVIDTIPGLVWSALPNGRVETFNARWRDYTGLAHEAGSGWGWDAIIHPDDLAAFEACFSTGLDVGRRAETEARLRRADGQYRWFLFRAVPLLGKERLPKRWYGQATDIDDRKRAALIVSAEKQLLQSIATGAALPSVLEAVCRHIELVVCDAFASVLLVDRDKRRIRHGASPSLPSSFAALVDGLPCEAEGGPCAAAIATRTAVARDYDSDEPPPPHLREVIEQRGVASSLSVPFFSAQGEPLGALTLYGPRETATAARRREALVQFAHLATIAVEREHDVTERRASEARLRQMQDELAHVTRVSTLGELTASIAHELNQPLTGIVVGASTCMRWLGHSPPRIDEALESAQRIRRDGQRAGEVIARLRDLFQKDDSGPMGPVDVNQTVQEVLVLTRSELQKWRVSLAVELDGAVPLALGHRVQIQQVVLNLIVNAGEALEGVEGRTRSVEVRTALVGAEIHVRVRDNGRGIAEADMPRVFEAFHTSKSSGMGMGLAVSRTIVEAHGGRLWVEANEGDGVTFAFSLARHG
jgi:PAS domain S-box-containing protein